MLTRLFNNSSFQSLVHALILSYLLTGIAVWLREYYPGIIQLGTYSTPFSPVWYEVLVVIFCPLIALWFNSALHSAGFLKGHFYLLPLFSIQLLLLAFLDSRPDILFALPFIVLFFIIKYNLTDAQEPLQQCFDLGFLLGIGSVFLPQVLFLLPAIWLALIIFGQFTFRTLLIPPLGLFAFYFLIFAVFSIFTDLRFFELFSAHFSSMGFGLHGMNFGGLWSYLPIGLILAVAVLEYTRAANHAKIRKRRFINLNIGLIIYLIFVGAFAEDREAIYTFLVFPMSILQSNLLQYLKKWWMQDLVFLGVICSLMIALL